MEVRAISRYVRVSPQKTRLVIDLIRGKRASGSLEILEAMNKRGAGVIGKVLAAAVASARQKELDIDTLWIKKAIVDGGPTYKRFMPRAMGRATMIKKPTSHITIVLSDEKGAPKPLVAAPKVASAEEKKKPRVKRLLRRGRKKEEKGKEKVKKEKKK